MSRCARATASLEPLMPLGFCASGAPPLINYHHHQQQQSGRAKETVQSYNATRDILDERRRHTLNQTLFHTIIIVFLFFSFFGSSSFTNLFPSLRCSSYFLVVIDYLSSSSLLRSKGVESFAGKSASCLVLPVLGQLSASTQYFTSRACAPTNAGT